MKNTRTQTKINSTTAWGILVTTDIPTQKTTAYNNGTLIYKKSLCGSMDLGQAHLANVLDFMRLAKVADLKKPINF
jgi:D-arabinose 1-dehydrogenase-like Zn-dependent alcohol dehydrogenase